MLDPTVSLKVVLFLSFHNIGKRNYDEKHLTKKSSPYAYKRYTRGAIKNSTKLPSKKPET